MPNASSVIERAAIPAPIATAASISNQPTVRYSRRKASRTSGARSASEIAMAVIKDCACEPRRAAIIWCQPDSGLSRGFCKTITFGKGQATHCCWSTQRSTICDLDHTKEKPEQQQRHAGNRTNKVQIMAGTVRGSPVHRWQQMKRLAYVDRNHHKQTAGASRLESRRPARRSQCVLTHILAGFPKGGFSKAPRRPRK